jgi:acyl-CoA synthetase (AMP-forming)/AMP-acid ligase II
MSLNLVSLLRESARQAPDHTAIVIDEKTFTYAELFGIVQRFAGAPLAPEDRDREAAQTELRAQA